MDAKFHIHWDQTLPVSSKPNAFPVACSGRSKYKQVDMGKLNDLLEYRKHVMGLIGPNPLT